MKSEIIIAGMTCANCAKSVSKTLHNIGLSDVYVDFANGKARFKPNPTVEESSIKKALKSIGFQVIDPKTSHSSNKKLTYLFWISVILTIPLFAHMFFPPWSFLYNPWLQLSLCIPVYIIGLYYFGPGAWGSIKNGVPNMDVLILLGASAAFAYSLWGFVNHYAQLSINEYLFFETTATIITLVLLGNLIEHYSVKRTGDAIEQLYQMQSKTVLKWTDGKWLEADLESIVIQDRIKLNSGNIIPVDGILEEGNFSINESLITGESLPLDKRKNDKVISGTTILDGNGIMLSTSSGISNTLTNIIDLVQNAQNTKPNIQRLGDKASAIFVPVVLLISIATFLFNFYGFKLELEESLMRSVAVILISCPCAMGLATPTAIMVGLGKAAKSGILFKSGVSIEELAKTKSIVFDKTGTLTDGNFVIKDIECFDLSQREVKELVFSLELHSNHPIAKSVVKSFGDETRELAFEEIVELKGLGMKATDKNGNRYLLGSSILTESFHSKMLGNLFLIKNEKLVAAIHLSDSIKQNTKPVTHYFLSQNIDTLILSGDHQSKCDEIAASSNIKTSIGNLLPQDKLKKIEQLQKNGSVCMVGDGINDAPSLSKANVGISLSDGSDIAIHSADVILLHKNDLKSLISAHKISLQTVKTIKQNLFWAFAYNIIAIPLAALGFLSPMLAALSMAFSDIIVIGNSLRIKMKS